MRIKIIQHKRMDTSINYLYSKLENPDTKLHQGWLGTNPTVEHFNEHVNQVLQSEEEKTGKKLDRNNMIKHMAITFHPKDRQKLESLQDEILKKVIEDLGIEDAHNFGLTAFIHNDRAHPHIHIAFTRVGIDGRKFDDKKIGWRVNDLAKKLEKEFNLVVASSNKPKISIQSKYLYSPTGRGELLKLINHALENARSFTEYKSILNKHGIFPKVDEKSGTITYVNNKLHDAYPEKILPKQARLSNIHAAIKSHKLTKEQQEVRANLQNAIHECKSLEELKNLFKGSKIYFEKDGDYARNIKIHTESQIITLEDFVIANPKVEAEENITKFEYIKKPIIFEDIYHDRETEFEEKKQQRQAKKSRRKGKNQDGMKVKY